MNSFVCNVEALRLPCVHFSFLLNIASEYAKMHGRCQPRAGSRCGLETLAIGFSATALLVVASYNIATSTRVLTAWYADWGLHDPEDQASSAVSPGVLLSFALVDLLVVDLPQLGAFLLRRRGGWPGLGRRLWGSARRCCSSDRHAPGHAAAQDEEEREASNELKASDAGDSTEGPGAKVGELEAGELTLKGGDLNLKGGELQLERGELDDDGELNMLSALAHVVSDLVRTLTILLEAGLIFNEPMRWFGNTDATASLIVSGVTIAIAIYVGGSLVRSLQCSQCLH